MTTATTNELYINVWVGNLGKYNEGELVGEWFTLPCDMQEVAEKIGLNEQYEEYQINDYETNIEGLEIHHYSSLNTLNELAEQLEKLDPHEQLIFRAYVKENGIEQVLSEYDSISFDDAMIYYDVNDMEEVVAQYLEETDSLSHVAKDSNYIDEDALLRDLYCGGDIQGYFYHLAYDNAIEEGKTEEEAQQIASDYEITKDDEEYYLEMVLDNITHDEKMLERYFDYEAYGRDMELEGTFVFLDDTDGTSVCVQLF